VRVNTAFKFTSKLFAGYFQKHSFIHRHLVYQKCYTRPMKIYSWNVNGIRAVHNKELFIPFIEKHEPDILCLQETKAQQNQSEVDLPDYIEYWNSADKRGYSGTAIFTKTKPIAVINGIPDN